MFTSSTRRAALVAALTSGLLVLAITGVPAVGKPGAEAVSSAADRVARALKLAKKASANAKRARTASQTALARADQAVAQATAGPAGPRGPAGAKGDPGAPGPKGDPGPTAGAAAGGADPPSTPTEGALATAQITLTVPSRLFVQGDVRHFGVDDDSTGCSAEVGLYVGTDPVPGSLRTLAVGDEFIDSSPIGEFTTAGLTETLPAGAYQVHLSGTIDGSCAPGATKHAGRQAHVSVIAVGGS